MSFNPEHHRQVYERILGPLSQPVTLHVNKGDGTGYTDYPVQAFVSRWREQDLVPDGSIRLGDLRLIIDSQQLPADLRRLEQQDKVTIDGRPYGVILWDPFTRTVGAEKIAVEATVRGG